MGVGGNVESEMSSSVASDTPQTALPAEEVHQQHKEDVQRSNGGHGTMVQASDLVDANDGFDEKMIVGDEDASSSPSKLAKDQQASARSNDAGSSSDIDVTSNFDLSDAVRMIKSESAAAKVSALAASDASKSRDPNLKERLKRVKSHVVSALFRHAKSVAFREPVNAKALGIFPIYHQIIKDPMDLGTVKRKIDRGQYTSMQDCLDDIQLIWENAKLFNAPGHQVHQAALFMETLTQEKLAKLQRDEAAGTFNQPKEKKRPFMSLNQSKLLRSPPTPSSVASSATATPSATPMVSPPIRRPQRKTSMDFPGEASHRPRRSENLPELLKQCDLVLKELMATKGTGSGVEHFLRVSPGSRRSVTTGEPLTDPMDLQKVQKRMQSGYYRHPLQFADDVRKIVSEAYAMCAPSESAPREPLAVHASQLHHTFETIFARRIDVLPVENPSVFYSPTLKENERFIGDVRSAMEQVLTIKNNVNALMGALVRMRQAKASGGRKAPSAMNNGPRKRGRPPNENAGPAKKARTSAAFPVQPAQPAAAVAVPPAAAPAAQNKHTLTVEESMALREEVSMLNEIQQQKIVQIMMDNREVLVTDANGFTEIDLGNCTAKTIKEIQDYIGSTKPGANSAPPPAAAAAAGSGSAASSSKRPQNNNNLSGSSKRSSPQKQNRSGDGNLSDSSSGSSGDSDSSSSSDSSDSDSD